jgi:hypothetical protein
MNDMNNEALGQFIGKYCTITLGTGLSAYTINDIIDDISGNWIVLKPGKNNLPHMINSLYVTMIEVHPNHEKVEKSRENK